MSSGYYPPGHPTGIDRGAVLWTCPECRETVEVGYTYDRAVNAFDLDDPIDICPRCNHIIEDKEWDNLEPVEPDEPDYDPSHY